MYIYDNTMALNATKNLGITQKNISKNLEKLSSGLRINSASDDAAGMAISAKMTAQLKGMERAELNAQDAISLVQTGEGALQTISGIFDRLVDLATEAATNSLNSSDRTKISAEYSALKAQINQIASNVNYNSIKLLSGGFSAGKVFQIGAQAAEKMTIAINRATFSAMVTGGTLSLGTVTGANAAITKLQNTIEKLASRRAQLGSYQNRLTSSIDNLSNMQQNLTTSRARVRDLDMAREMTEYSRNQILQQTGIAMLAQANQIPSQILSLMR